MNAHGVHSSRLNREASFVAAIAVIAVTMLVAATQGSSTQRCASDALFLLPSAVRDGGQLSIDIATVAASPPTALLVDMPRGEGWPYWHFEASSGGTSGTATTNVTVITMNGGGYAAPSLTLSVSQTNPASQPAVITATTTCDSQLMSTANVTLPAVVGSASWAATLSGVNISHVPTCSNINNNSDSSSVSSKSSSVLRAIIVAHDSFSFFQRTTSASSSATTCAIRHADAYLVNVIPAGIAIEGVEPSYCNYFGSVSDAHYACSRDALCLGYTSFFAQNITTSRSGSSNDATCGSMSEVPLCLLLAGTSSDAAWAAGTPRILYTKPQANITCEATVGGTAHLTTPSSAVDVWLAQSSMQSAVADVYVNGSWVRRCGGLRFPFSDGQMGMDGMCSTEALCVRLMMTNNNITSSPVHVAVVWRAAVTRREGGSGVIPSQRCNASFGARVSLVMVDSSTASNGTAVINTTLIQAASETTPVKSIIALVNDTEGLPLANPAAAVKHQWVVLRSLVTNVFVSGLTYLSVASQNTNVSSADAVTVTTTGGGRTTTGVGVSPVLAVCNASTTSMYRCDAMTACRVGSGATSLTTTPFTGYVRFEMSSALLAASLEGCDGLRLRLTAVVASNADGFLLGSSVNMFQPLVAVAPSLTSSSSLTSSDAVQALFSNPASLPNAAVAELSSMFRVVNATPDAFGVIASPVSSITAMSTNVSQLRRAWFTVPRTVTLATSSAATSMHPNVTLGVFMDAISDGGDAYFLIPTSATQVTLLVSQALWTSGAVIVIELWKGYSLWRTVSCYQSADLEMKGATSDSCQTLAVCREGFALSEGVDSAIVTLGSSMDYALNPDCHITVGVVMQFSSLPIVAASSSPCRFECPSTRLCLSSRQQVCDGVVDCPDGFDETICHAWSLLESGNALPSSTGLPPTSSTFAVSLTTTATVTSCKVAASMALANAFVFLSSASSASCFVYNVSATALANPAGSLQPLNSSSGQFFARLGGDNPDATDAAPSMYGGCSSSYSCNGRGVATGGTADECSCLCNADYSGARCEVVLADMDDVHEYVIHIQVPVAATSTTSSSSNLLPFATPISPLSVQWVLQSSFDAAFGANMLQTTCDVLGRRNQATDDNLAVVVAYRCRLTATDSSVTSSLTKTVASLFNANVIQSTFFSAFGRFYNASMLSMVRSSFSRTFAVRNCAEVADGFTCDEPQWAAFVRNASAQGAAWSATAPRPNNTWLRFSLFVDSSEAQALAVTSSLLPSATNMCGNWISVLIDGCMQMTCLAVLESNETIFAASSLRLTSNGSQLSSQLCFSRHGMDVSITSTVALQPVSATAAAADRIDLAMHDASLRLPLLIVGSVLVAIGGLSMLAAVGVLVRDWLDRREIAIASSAEVSAVTQILRKGFMRLKHYLRTPDRIPWEKYGAALGIVGYFALLLGGVGLLIALRYPQTASYVVIVETFTSPDCGVGVGSALLASAPTALSVVDPAAGCSPSLNSVGTNGFGAMTSVQASCYRDGNGTLMARVVFGCSGSSGVPTTLLAAANGSCVPSSSASNSGASTATRGVAQDPFVRVLCSETNAAMARVATYPTGVVATLQPSTVSVRSPAAGVRQPAVATPSTADSGAGLLTITRRPFQKAFAVGASTSGYAEAITTTADAEAALRSNDLHASRLVFQTTESMTVSDVAALQLRALPDVVTAATTETVLTSISSSSLWSGGLSSYAPAILDAPIGFVFQAFNTSVTSSASTSVLPSSRQVDNAQRYYAIEKTELDVGYYYGPESTDEGLGVTISCYVRLDHGAQGFIYVSADALEVLNTTDMAAGSAASPTITSPLVDLLLQTEQQLLDGSDAWFQNDMHVYSSLYVSAVTRRLHFVMASPLQAKTSWLDVTGNATRFTRGYWDLDTIGFGDLLFNQEWHYIVVTIQNENSQIKARLMIDGFTDTDRKWTQCLTRRPSPVASWTEGQSVGSVNPAVSTPVSGGVLYVGLLDGAVYGLRFEPQVVRDLSLRLRGTAPMRNLHNEHRGAVMSIAVALIAIATIMSVFTLCGSGYAVSTDSNKMAEQDTQNCVDKYVKLTRHVVTDDAGNPYPRVSFEAAQRWMDLNQAQFSLFLDEMQQSAKFPHREILRTLSMVRTAWKEHRRPDVNFPLPTFTEWLAILDDEKTHPKPRLSKSFIEKVFFGDSDEGGSGFLHPAELEMRSKEFPTEVEVVEARKARRVAKRNAAAKRRKQVEQAATTFVGLDEMVGSPVSPRFCSTRDDDEGDDEEDLGQEAAEMNFRTAGANYVDIGGGFGKTRGGVGGLGDGPKSSAGSGAGSNEFSAQIYNFLLPVISSLQTAYVWMTATVFPSSYDSTFGNFFSALAIDIAQMVQKVAAYVTPLSQCIAGFIIIAAFYYLSTIDNRMFEWYAIRYAFRRDQLEGRAGTQAKRSSSNSPAGSPSVKTKGPFGAIDALSNSRSSKHERQQVEAQRVAAIATEEEAAIAGGGCSSANGGGGMSRSSFLQKTPSTAAVEEQRPSAPFSAAAILSQEPAPRPVYAFSLTESKFLRELQDPFDDTASPGVRYEVELLPLTQCQKIDRFVGAFESGRDDPLRVAETMRIKDDEGTHFMLSRGVVPPKRMSHKEAMALAAKNFQPKQPDPALPNHSYEPHPADSLHVALDEAAAAAIGQPAVTAGNGDAAAKKHADAQAACCPSLEVLGCFCRRHPWHRLSPLIQTIVWPFEDPPTCCVIVNGRPCGQRSGLIYSCGVQGMAAEGRCYSCDYAICELHFRGGVKEVLLAKVVGVIRLVQDRGWAWALSVVFVSAANAAYTPFIKTALMIVSCHPYFQCTFSCWDQPDVLFGVAVFLSLAMVVLFGLGVPLMQLALLRYRQGRLKVLFLAPEYGGRYTEDAPHPPRLQDMNAFEFFFGIFTGNTWVPLMRFLDEKAEATRQMIDKAVTSAAADGDDAVTMAMTEGGGEEDEEEEADEMGGATKTKIVPDQKAVPSGSNNQKTAVPPPNDVFSRPVVSVAEWARFLAADPSALAVLYNTLELNFMHMSPILLMFKVIIIAQVVFLPSGSLQQRIGMAVVEIAFAALVFFTAPFTSPTVDAMYRLASIHQLFLLGFQNLNDVYAMDGSSTSLGFVMLGTSAIYIAIALVVTVLTSVWPAIKSVRDREASRKVLQDLGFQYSETTNLYVTPVEGRGVRVRQLTNDNEEGGEEVEQQQQPPEQGRNPLVAAMQPA